ncbi:uncharacterized protein [Diadema antillarum]|uniref:uncharacterized protein n=1 Tax=Diadema antillarum TaxID=105358 RepID=UPI003A8A6E3F
MSGVKKKRWKGPVPVSAIQNVLLKDNRFADILLEDRLKQVGVDRRRAKNLLDWQHQSFVLNQAIKETELREMGVNHTSFLPEVTMKVTEPAVRARRPFGKVRRSASHMIEELTFFEKRYSLPVITARRSLTLPEFSVSVSSRGQRKGTFSQPDPGNSKDTHFHKDSGNEEKESFTHLHGIDLRKTRKSKTGPSLSLGSNRRESVSGSGRLCGNNLPLYGPEAEAAREEREKRYVRNLQQKMREMKIDHDDRFLRLEKSLVRDAKDEIDTVRAVNDKHAQARNAPKLRSEERIATLANNDIELENRDTDDESDSDDDDTLEGPRQSNMSRLSTKSTLDLTFSPGPRVGFFD